LECTQGDLVEHIILNHFVKRLTMELEVHLDKFPHIPRQFFHIENILINNLPLQVGPSVVEMCSKMEFFMHFIPIFLCHLVEKIPISIIWVKVQGTKHCNDHDGVIIKVAKLNKCTPCCHFHTSLVPHSFCI